MARMSPGTDSSHSLLCQTLWHMAEATTSSEPWKPSLVTVTEVLTYSLTSVMTPSAVVVHACTHQTKLVSSNPSAMVTDPKATMRSGTSTGLEGEEVVVAVRRGMRWWRWEGGPWNHHSKSGARRRCIVLVSFEIMALYKSVTVFLLRSSWSCSHGFCELEFASSGILRVYKMIDL